jgi:hypothetical protein
MSAQWDEAIMPTESSVASEIFTHARCESLNHAPGDTINPQEPIAADANTQILLPLSGP